MTTTQTATRGTTTPIDASAFRAIVQASVWAGFLTAGTWVEMSQFNGLAIVSRVERNMGDDPAARTVTIHTRDMFGRGNEPVTMPMDSWILLPDEIDPFATEEERSSATEDEA